MVDTAVIPGTVGTDIYDRIGVRTVINGRGATTAVGGTLMRPETLAAMAEATKAFVVIEELNAKVGEKIAEVTGAEAGYVTCGSAAAMAIAAAACIAGTDPERISKLPDSTGMVNEIVIHRAHRINYDGMYRAAGGKLVEIGMAFSTERWELERAITERTAAIAYHDSPNCSSGALDFATVVEIARERNIPVIVDSASTLPPLDHLRRWIRWGADLVIYSGGKGIRGPQDSGMLAGRADLIAAARLNGSPNPAVGRGMKVSKEAMVGLWVALDAFMTTDHEAEYRVRLEYADSLAALLNTRTDVRAVVESDWDEWPAPIVRIFPRKATWKPVPIRDALMACDPPIHINIDRSHLMVSTHCLLPGDVETIADRLGKLLDQA